MFEEIKNDRQSDVDRGLVAMFLKMSPEERLRANDNALRTILELRDAYRRQKANERKPK
jgi:hypothetical protein